MEVCGIFGLDSIFGGGGGFFGIGDLFKGDFGGFLEGFISSAAGASMLGFLGPWTGVVASFASSGGFSDLINGNGIEQGTIEAVAPQIAGMITE